VIQLRWKGSPLETKNETRLARAVRPPLTLTGTDHPVGGGQGRADQSRPRPAKARQGKAKQGRAGFTSSTTEDCSDQFRRPSKRHGIL
jgi:ribosomal protein L2